MRPALDFDHDGFPGLLGGGDCDDGNPAINPSAQDWPEDGVDQDCDGRDLRAVDLRPPPLHRVPAAVPRDLNILFIVIDTLRADRLGAYGYKRPTSPELDRLAADGGGVRERLGPRPLDPLLDAGHRHRALALGHPLGHPHLVARASAREHRTIAEVLRERGYFNGAYYAYEYFNRVDGRGFERGIDQYDDRLAAKHIDTRAARPNRSGSSAREMADDGIDFLKVYRDQKFFLTLHFYDPHLDYERQPGAPDFGSTPADLYDGEIWFTDKNVGRVIGALRELGLYEQTAIFVTGDHGEGLGEHGIMAHGYDLYAPQTKVPLIVRVPGLGSRRVKAPVGHVDLAPTLVNLAGGPPGEGFLGRSMVDLLAGIPGASPPPEYVFQEVSFPPEPPRFPSQTERRALASATHHLHLEPGPREHGVLLRPAGPTPARTATCGGPAPASRECSELKRALDRKLSLLKLSRPAPRLHRARLAVGERARAPPRPGHRACAWAVRRLGPLRRLQRERSWARRFPARAPGRPAGGPDGEGDARGGARPGRDRGHPHRPRRRGGADLLLRGAARTWPAGGSSFTSTARAPPGATSTTSRWAGPTRSSAGGPASASATASASASPPTTRPVCTRCTSGSGGRRHRPTAGCRSRPPTFRTGRTAFASSRSPSSSGAGARPCTRSGASIA